MGASPMMRAGMTPPNKGRKYPAEVLTPAEVAAVIGRCSARARTGIRNRALLMLLYRSGLRVSEALALRASDVSGPRPTTEPFRAVAGAARRRVTALGGSDVH